VLLALPLSSEAPTAKILAGLAAQTHSRIGTLRPTRAIEGTP
jgi:hypothetical protein